MSNWGYGAVIVPDKLFWQGLLLTDPKDLAPQVGQAISAAHVAFSAMGKSPVDSIVFGAVQAGLVACVLDHRDEASQAKAAVFAACVSELSGKRFWIVQAWDDAEGTTTDFFELEVETVEQAKAEIERRVAPLKLALLINMTKETK